MIKEQLNSEVYSYMSSDDKHLIVEFTAAMNTLGYQPIKKMVMDFVMDVI